MINPFRKNDSAEKNAEQELSHEFKIATQTIAAEKPRVLLLGQTGAGKTSLLAKSAIAFESPFKKSLAHMDETRTIDWWSSADAVFIDPAGKLCFAGSGDPQAFRTW